MKTHECKCGQEFGSLLEAIQHLDEIINEFTFGTLDRKDMGEHAVHEIGQAWFEI